jgi:hypothetical protein
MSAIKRSALWRQLADCRQCLRILEWRLLMLGLRKRPQAWSKNNSRPFHPIAADADQR